MNRNAARDALKLNRENEMMNTDDLRYYTGIGTGYSQEIMMQRAADEIDRLRAECTILRQSIRQTLDENSHLADGENCTLIGLKQALRKVGTPWEGDE